MRTTTRIIALGCLLSLTAAFGSASAADRRVALIIGNSAYKNVGQLPNPAHDAAAIGALLKRAGFEVVETQRDLTYRAMGRAIRDFSDHARDADVAVVFYAGHGIEVDGTNYLVPVDAALQRDIDVEYEAHPLDRVVRILEPAKRLRLVILDACRDNPFTRSMKRTIASRSIGRGLARVEVVSSDTLIAFAAKAGSTAADGSGANSPFTAALLNHLATPGLDLRISLGRVRDEVLKVTHGKQEPFVYGSLGGSTVALVPPPAQPPPATVAAPPPPRAVNPDEAARRDFELAADIGTKEVWERFLKRYPAGFYADLARAALRKLEAEAETAKTVARPERADDAGVSAAKPPAQKPAARPERKSTRSTSPDKPSGSSGAQVYCGPTGCRTVPKNCRVVATDFQSDGGRSANLVCN